MCLRSTKHLLHLRSWWSLNWDWIQQKSIAMVAEFLLDMRLVPQEPPLSNFFWSTKCKRSKPVMGLLLYVLVAGLGRAGYVVWSGQQLKKQSRRTRNFMSCPPTERLQELENQSTKNSLVKQNNNCHK